MKVSELLTDESKWTKGCYARGVDGVSVSIFGDDAVCWCIEGAMHRCYGNAERLPRYLQLAAALGNPSQWNDAPERTFADVRQLITELDI